MLRSVVNLSLAALLLSACGSGEPDPRPASQITFTAAVAQYAEEYRAANDLRRPEIRAARKDAVLAAAPGGEVVNWRGNIKEIATTSQGARLVLKLPGSNCLIESHREFGIPADSPAFELLKHLKSGDSLFFSGMLVPDKKDGFLELSLTESGGMSEPEYSLIFVALDQTRTDESLVAQGMASADEKFQSHLAKLEAKLEAERERRERPHNSEWDGSVRQVKRYLQRNLVDPKSYQSIEWGKVLAKDSGPCAYLVRHKYRAKNSFGGYVVEDQGFCMDAQCTVIDALSM